MAAGISDLNALNFLRESQQKYERDCTRLVDGKYGPFISCIYSELCTGVNPTALLDKEQKMFVHKTVRLIAQSFWKDVEKNVRTGNIYWDPQVRQEVVQLLLYIHSCIPAPDLCFK